MNAKHNDEPEEPATVDIDDLEPGDHLSVDVGDWNAQTKAWNFHNYTHVGEQNGLMVVETDDDAVTVIDRGDRLDYNQSDRLKEAHDVDVDTYELTRDGFLGDDGLRLKSYEVVPGRSGFHFVSEAHR